MQKKKKIQLCEWNNRFREIISFDSLSTHHSILQYVGTRKRRLPATSQQQRIHPARRDPVTTTASITNIPNWKPDSNFDATSYPANVVDHATMAGDGHPIIPQKSRALCRFNAELIKRYVIPAIIHGAFETPRGNGQLASENEPVSHEAKARLRGSLCRVKCSALQGEFASNRARKGRLMIRENHLGRNLGKLL